MFGPTDRSLTLPKGNFITDQSFVQTINAIMIHTVEYIETKDLLVATVEFLVSANAPIPIPHGIGWRCGRPPRQDKTEIGEER